MFCNHQQLIGLSIFQLWAYHKFWESANIISMKLRKHESYGLPFHGPTSNIRTWKTVSSSRLFWARSLVKVRATFCIQLSYPRYPNDRVCVRRVRMAPTMSLPPVVIIGNASMARSRSAVVECTPRFQLAATEPTPVS